MFLRMFFRKSNIEPLPITMTGIRMGERVLQIGITDPATVGMLAKKVGMSGLNALAAPTEADAERARHAAADAAVLIDVQVTPWRQKLPFEAGTFDLVVVHGDRGLLAGLEPEDRVVCLQEAKRMLRNGGRIIVIEEGERGGLGRLLQGQSSNDLYAAYGGAETALKAEGFRPVRVLGNVDGYKFTEGLNT